MIAARRLRRLLVAVPSTRFGGTERHAAELAARFGAAGLTVTLAAEPGMLGPLRTALPAGFPEPVLLPAAIGWAEGEAEAAAGQRHAAAALLAAEAPEIVLLPLPWPNAGLGLMQALAAARLPRLAVLHLAAGGPAPAGIVESLAGLGVERTAWTAVSVPVARRAAGFFGLPAHRIAVIDNPAPQPPAPSPDRAGPRAALRRSLGLDADAPLVAFIGRLEEAKGADMLPAVTDRLGITLACIGEGPLRGYLDAQASADPRGMLRMIGQVADPTSWYLAADALLLPSRLEGAPLVFLEAASLDCPVVATAASLEGLAPGLARIAAPEPAALADALRALLADAAGTAAMVRRARAEAARRSWGRAMAAWRGQLRVAAMLAGSAA